jgi:hypothetical protein
MASHVWARRTPSRRGPALTAVQLGAPPLILVPETGQRRVADRCLLLSLQSAPDLDERFHGNLLGSLIVNYVAAALFPSVPPASGRLENADRHLAGLETLLMRDRMAHAFHAYLPIFT